MEGGRGGNCGGGTFPLFRTFANQFAIWERLSPEMVVRKSRSFEVGYGDSRWVESHSSNSRKADRGNLGLGRGSPFDEMDPDIEGECEAWAPTEHTE